MNLGSNMLKLQKNPGVIEYYRIISRHTIKDIVHLQGPKGLYEIKGFRDHSLKGDWQGARASRLNEQWRVIYYVDSNEVKILVLEVTPHDYRKKS